MQLTIPSSLDQFIGSVKDIDLSSRQQQTIGLITAATVVTSYTFYRLLFKGPSDGCPTVPYRDPIKGSSAEYRKDPRAFVEKWTKALGPVYRVHLYGRMHTIISGRYVREIFMNNSFDFHTGIEKRFDMKTMADISHSDVPINDTRTSVVQYLTPHLKHFTPRAVENLHLGLKDVLGTMEDGSVEIQHMYPLVQRMVARASASVFVGEKLSQDLDLIASFQDITTDLGSMIRFENYWLETFSFLMKLKMWAIGKFSSKVKKHRTTMLRSLTPEIDLRLSCAKDDPNWQKPNDILQELIDHAEVPRGRDIYTHIVNEIIVLIFASIHTTSENGTIVLYRILQNPELINELLEEQQETIEHAGLDPNGKSNEVFTFDTIKGMVKLDSFCREALRLRSEFYELAHTNISKQNVVLSNGTIIPPDGDVLINSWYNQQSNSWEEMRKDGEDRAQFKPFRYLNTGYPSTKVSDDYLVFGEGRRACPGRWFAIQEIKTIIALLIRDYKVRPTSDILFPTSLDTAMPFGSASFEKRN
ncbi:cytochrome P450 [Zychaea mexicana]|uniref:cytochrome P450 n=1 Tax=Zychaea mexicana TaxID=64656 RepID=UPI0022FF2C02|nr:cytochrome P450 [Zychaea mexicana]KAI9495643.1 cytochrome P450 [Zychaea mexicana]